MNSKLNGRILAVSGFLVVASALLAPIASAQGNPTIDFTLGGYNGAPVQPISQPVRVDVQWTYSLPVSQLQNLAGPTGTVTATFDVQCPQDKILQSGSEDVIITLTATQTTPYSGTLPITLIVLREAPGLVPIQCTISASATSAGGSSPAVPASNTKGGSFTVTPEYFSLLEATSSSKLRQGGPQKQIPFAIDLTNFGNAGTKVNFEVTEKPRGGWQGLLPDPVLLDAPGGNLQTKQIVFNVATPYKNGWNNEEGAFTIKMTPEYQFKTSDTQVGSPVTLTVLARVRGVYVPSLEPMVLVGAILGTALLARLRAGDEE